MDRRKFMQSTLGTIGGLLGLGCVPKLEAKPKAVSDNCKCGHWINAILGDAKSKKWCDDHGLELKSEWDGGVFVRGVEIESLEPLNEAGPLIVTLNYHYDGEAPGVDWVTEQELE